MFFREKKIMRFFLIIFVCRPITLHINFFLSMSFVSYSSFICSLISFSFYSSFFQDRDMLKQLTKPIPGSLVVEPYTWKKVAASSPMLKIRTSGIKAVALTLPPGYEAIKPWYLQKLWENRIKLVHE